MAFTAKSNVSIFFSELKCHEEKI